MSLDVTFRPMVIADLVELMPIEKRAYSHSWSHGIFADCLNAGYECWVVEKDAKLIGHGVMSVVVGESHLLNITIAPELQGGGIGRDFLNQLKNRARELSADVMFLEVRPSNPGAIHLYLSEGFKEVGRRKDYYPAESGREEAVVMSCSLTAE